TSFHATIGARPIRASFVLQNLGSQLKHDGSGLDAGVTRPPPLGTPEVPQEPQPARLRASGWDLPVLFRVSAALDLYSSGQNRVTALGEFTQPNNTKPGAGGGLELSSANIGNSGFSLAARASYTIHPYNNVNDISFGALSTTATPGSFTEDGIAVGGGGRRGGLLSLRRDGARQRWRGAHVAVLVAGRAAGAVGRSRGIVGGALRIRRTARPICGRRGGDGLGDRPCVTGAGRGRHLRR